MFWVVDMDIHGLMGFLPLLGLTAGWRGVRVGGKTLGMGGGLGASSNPLVQQFDKAKAEGDRTAMERIARQMNEARLKQNETRGRAKPSGGAGKNTGPQSNSTSKFPAPKGVKADTVPPATGLKRYISNDPKWNAEQNAALTIKEYGLPSDYYTVQRSRDRSGNRTYELSVSDKYISEKTQRLARSYERTLENWGYSDRSTRQARQLLEASQKADIIKVREEGKV